MKKIIKGTIFLLSIFVFIFFGFAALAQEAGNNNDVETEEEKMEALREDLEALMEKVEMVAEKVLEMKEEGKLPIQREEVATECELYLTEYIKYGAENNPQEVEKLQIFLNRHMGENIPVTGFYGEMTRDAVMRFQERYKDEILKPWADAGIHADGSTPTGYVYKTTKRWINVLECPGKDIPLPNFALYEPTTAVVDNGIENGEILGEEEVGDEIVAVDEDGEEIDEELDTDIETEEMEEDEREQDTATLVIMFVALALLGVTLHYIFKPTEKKRI